MWDLTEDDLGLQSAMWFDISSVHFILEPQSESKADKQQLNGNIREQYKSYLNFSGVVSGFIISFSQRYMAVSDRNKDKS